jgi:Tfp pilus assembly protein PilF
MPTAAHFIYIPAVLLFGIVIGWVLGSRAAADAYAAKLRKLTPNSQPPTPKDKPH